MPLPDPQLDDRRFQDIVNEAKAHPALLPGVDGPQPLRPGRHADRALRLDDGPDLYRLNRVPDKNYLRFMDLLGIQLKDPVPAETRIIPAFGAPAGAVTITRGT